MDIKILLMTVLFRYLASLDLLLTGNLCDSFGNMLDLPTESPSQVVSALL